jgi:replication-associated recombination protein RarA
MLAVTTKSNAVGRGYFAAMADVLEKGSLAVPAHLRSSGAARRNYRYPHDFEGDDVDQQYLPDGLIGRRYYFPGDQGAEARIGERLARLANARRAAPRRKRLVEGQPASDPMATGSEGMRRRQQSLRDLADEHRRDAEE